MFLQTKVRLFRKIEFQRKFDILGILEKEFRELKNEISENELAALIKIDEYVLFK